MPHGGAPDRRTSTGDFTTTTSLKGRNVLLGARLIAAGAAATAQLQDGDGTVLVDLSALTNQVDEFRVPVAFNGKVTLAALSGAGAVVNIYVE